MQAGKLRPVRTLSEHLALHLAREIVAGRLKPGSAVPSEPELAAEFEISKAVVRQSIQALASLGLVRVQQGKRTIVQDETEWNVLASPVLQAFYQEARADELTGQLYDVRLALETNAAAWTAERGSQEELACLTGLAERMRGIADGPRDLRAFLATDLEFHNVVGAAAGNLVLRGVMRALHAFLSAYWQDSRIVVDQLETLAEQHASIAAAINARDPARARHAMETHLRWARQIDLGSPAAPTADQSPPPGRKARAPRARDTAPGRRTRRRQ